MINVTSSFLPPYELFENYVKGIWDRNYLTNNGPLVIELEKKLKEYLNVRHLFFTSNGTIALQIAIKALGLQKEVITTPFSYVATTNSLLWENCKPVFVDINDHDFNIDEDKIERAITSETEAILATHVYGNPCNVERIEAIARQHDLKIIYDGAHGFDAKYNHKQVLSYGDISTCSFHATKLFHSVEGGCVITNDDELANKIMLSRQFGHVYDDYFSVGINGKNSEFHAAMGLSVLPSVKEIIKSRKTASESYDLLLKDLPLSRPVSRAGTEYNYAYYPVVFESEKVMLKVKEDLAKCNIFSRRYFYPSLNKLPFYQGQSCPVSERISSSVLSLPLFFGMDNKTVELISNGIHETLNNF